ncbi:HAMP domain-containing sensor histidine kinase [Robiginitalea sp. M366]|uniref:sensor histidine kinase n=1 Tax=Robiginitalea aestuariiviva TaxID=3036903 RepID=UPI00240D1E72|nr:HAMP domain-containing sensor histidine kinase [Robiginitalea aestuariiviva]MDG1573127.1 HAMP domain-containing sensor histidine kinase [Robiginitalea aestuariiviva]
MNRKLFVLLVILMSLSLIGIIAVQIYWIRNSVQDKEEQFSSVVTDVLNRVSDMIEEREMKDYSERFLNLKDSIGELQSRHLSDIFFVDRDLNSNEILVYSHGILEEDYNIASTFFDSGTATDSATIKSYTSRRSKTLYREEFGLDGKAYRLNPIERWEKVGGLGAMEKAMFDDVYREYAEKFPIHERVSREEIEMMISRELESHNLDIDYEYGVYSRGLPTKVKSRRFKYEAGNFYKAPLFRDSEGNTDYALLLSFPREKKFILASVLGMAGLSLLFTLIIMIAYASAIYQLIRQKQISEIKSDFINNMTHEFKTPIATINLAVEAIRNPKVIGDVEKTNRYLQMIRDENKRMNAQVENVLRISKLEKNQLDISKERLDLHDLIRSSIDHVELIVKDRGGYVKSHLEAERCDVLANEMHLGNVIVNILDNAVKYSPEAPKIDVYTEMAKNAILIRIQDQGAGMSKAVLKRIFEKFYREHTGDIHNVKGHGLGLAYVKKIVEDHQGEVYAESEKGKGSTFFIKLPLI